MKKIIMSIKLFVLALALWTMKNYRVVNLFIEFFAD
jgi:ABC-type uncharacterized transport system permease subunit